MEKQKMKNGRWVPDYTIDNSRASINSSNRHHRKENEPISVGIITGLYEMRRDFCQKLSDFMSLAMLQF